MEQYTLIGHPLGHSMSPFIHERLFAMAGREASYTLTDIAPEHLEGKEPFLRSLQGFNITIPHKMAVIPMVDRLDESARRYDSVNCVANVDGKLVGKIGVIGPTRMRYGEITSIVEYLTDNLSNTFKLESGGNEEDER